MRISALLPILVILVSISCSNDDDGNELVLKHVVGIVKGHASCQTLDNGLVQQLELESPISTESNRSLKTIGITNLPEEMKMAGLKINMDIKRAVPEGPCAMIYSPEFFYQAVRAEITP